MTVKWDRKRLINAHGWMKANKQPIAYPISGSGYWSWPTVKILSGERKGHQAGANWVLVGSGKKASHVVKERLHASQDGEIGFHTFAELAEWAKEHLGITGWDCLSGMNDWVPSPDSTERPCEENVHHGDSRSGSHGICGKPVKENGLCGRHLNVRKRRHEADQQYDDWRESQDSNSRIAEDAVNALKEFTPEGKDNPGVPSHPYYHHSYSGSIMTGGFTGEVTVHAEDLLAMLREIEWRRDAMGDNQ